jgi:hypothetical protein
VKQLSVSVLNVFREMRADLLDLHVLLESAGNAPEAREQVLDAVEELQKEGLLESKGSDFYALTAKGKSSLPPL